MMRIVKGCSAAVVAAMFLSLSDGVHGLGMKPQTEEHASAAAAAAPANFASGLPPVPIVNSTVPVGTLVLDTSAASNGTESKMDTSGAALNANWLYYRGGPVMLQPKVVMLYFTNSKVSSTYLSQWVAYANSFVSSLGASSRWAPTKAYYEVVNGVKKYMAGTLGFTSSYTVTVGTDYVFSMANIESSLKSWITSGQIVKDSNAVYVFATVPGSQMADNEGFCSSYCGYHYSMKISGVGEIKYAFVPAPDTCPNGCVFWPALYGSGKSPTGEPIYDGYFSVLFHELFEAVTDPSYRYSKAWLSPGGDENGDLCAWNFGALTYFKDTSGVKRAYNALVGGSAYFLQQSYDLVKQACVL